MHRQTPLRPQTRFSFPGRVSKTSLDPKPVFFQVHELVSFNIATLVLQKIVKLGTLNLASSGLWFAGRLLVHFSDNQTNGNLDKYIYSYRSPRLD